MAFKDRLKETRIKKGLSQEDLAKMLGVSKQAVQADDCENKGIETTLGVVRV